VSKKQSHSIYARDLIYVTPHPFGVAAHRLGEMLVPTATPWLMSSVVAGVAQRKRSAQHEPLGVEGSVAVVREDSEVFRTEALVREHLNLPDEQVTLLDHATFDQFTRLYVSGVNNLDALKTVVRAIERYAPSFRFMPPHLHYLLDLAEDNGTQRSPYRHLPRMFLRYDFSEYDALVWLNKGGGQISPKLLPQWQVDSERVLHVGGAWYAFRTLEEAVTTKFFAPETEIHRLREDV
jgi:hypothetical protein